MIVLIEPHTYMKNNHILREMFLARKQVFHDRLGWNVRLIGEEERDEYDDLNPLYLVAVDAETGRARGSLRLLPTTGRTMLGDIFRNYFDQPVDVRSPIIWECTRFCAHPNETDHLGPQGIADVTSELLIGICEAGLYAGISQIVGVFDRRMVRIYRRGAWSPEIIARSTGAGHGEIAVGLWDVTEDALAAMRARASKPAPVLRIAA